MPSLLAFLKLEEQRRLQLCDSLLACFRLGYQANLIPVMSCSRPRVLVYGTPAWKLWREDMGNTKLRGTRLLGRLCSDYFKRQRPAEPR